MIFDDFNWFTFGIGTFIFLFFVGIGYLLGRPRKPKLTPVDFDYAPIHYWFELSYAQYVALPRSILQNMPVEWQRKFVALMDELDEGFDWRREGCRVRFVDRRGRYMGQDDFADYERGRRRLTSEDVSALVAAHNMRFERRV